ncbi:competence type IV pilus minor pilin ComGD [Halobacillus karajensis]|uniref:competence type IV pilus minor pilin ComGD n=1 Tax=Halobacillus karajensis TaxID=195088 RepID=UPI0006903DE4|nr:competence type IV pilus minor pilin ComGD [Halobacillus karajensis]
MEWLKPLNRQLYSQKAYTFSEMIIALMCWSILLLFFIPMQYRTYENFQASRTLQQLKEDVLLVQHLTMNDHIYYSLNFYQQKGTYELYDTKKRKTIFTRKLPEKWGMKLTTLPSSVRFNQKGMIRKAGTMHLMAPKKTYKIVFPFGSSRLRVEES